ncbi:MAG: 2Fe-2S iron-sulfur cluster binding domain-containing protein [Nostocaceae cyanobacterium]|nr:2Fe-2S iron-sulfur cluster binding domain-containing protein [Nostocaceae cyanobacterium]
MQASLKKNQNLVVRSLKNAALAGSIITMASAVILGVTNSKQDSAYKVGVYSTLIGTGCGALLGLAGVGISEGKTAQRESSHPDDKSTEAQRENAWRNFVVIRKVKESQEITSFYLQPEFGTLSNFQPGQFLTIKLDIPGQSKPVIRTYSLSDYHEPCEYYRLSIKREEVPDGLDVQPGIASNFMHDYIQEGSVIAAKPPSGKFILDVQKSLPVVLISNGVGITPMISMVKACSRLNKERSIWFVHGARNGEYHAFRDEIQALAAENPSLHVHFVYSRPLPEDKDQYHSVGYVDTVLIQRLVGHEAEYFLCGSPPFLQSLQEGLKAASVSEKQIFSESFSKTPPAIDHMAATSSDNAVESAEIVFAKSGKTFMWHKDDGSILEFAEANDLEPAYNCRQGICGTCMCKIQEGEVNYQETPSAEIDDGSVLICISQPKTSRVVLDV